MSDKPTGRSQAALTSELRDRFREATGSTSPAPSRTSNMHMTDAPNGPSRSLDELVGGGASVTPSSQVTPVQDTVVPIDLDRIVDSPYQPRTRYDGTELQLLAEQLRAQGQDEPVRVRHMSDGRYELISGHRRVRAASLIGWKQVDARILDLDDCAAKIATLTSNESHVGLSDFERGTAYQVALTDGLAKNQQEVASMFGCSQGRVSQCLSVARLPEPIAALLRDYPGLLTYRHAKVVREVLEHDANMIGPVLVAVNSMIDEPDLEPEQLRTRCMEAASGTRTRARATVPKIVPDSSGVSMFTVRSNKRNLVVGFNTALSDAHRSEVEKQVLAALKSIVENLPKNSN